jgi:hypothetical protein
MVDPPTLAGVKGGQDMGFHVTVGPAPPDKLTDNDYLTLTKVMTRGQ